MDHPKKNGAFWVSKSTWTYDDIGFGEYTAVISSHSPLPIFNISQKLLWFGIIFANEMAVEYPTHFETLGKIPKFHG